MVQRRSDAPVPAALAAGPPERRGLRTIHALIALTGMAVGLPLALIGGMALVGVLSSSPWIRVGVPLVVLIAVPLLIADRLLPADPTRRRPGLVRDVLCFGWAGAALAVVGLAGSLTGAPLTAEAARLDEAGWERAAWLGRWMAGPAPTSTSSSPDALARAPESAESEEPPGPEEPAGPEDTAGDPGSSRAGEAAATAQAPAPIEAPASTEAALAGEAVLAAGRGGELGEDEPAPEREYSPAELFTGYAPAVVAIEVEHGGFRSGGTGFFIDDRGTLATNHHVIDGAREVRIKLLDGTVLERVELLDSDADIDLALLRVDPSALPEALAPVRLGDSEAVQVGEPVSVIGNPLGLDHTLTDGIVSARRVYEGERYIQMSAPISPGNSGGPVFDRHGRVIGVSVAHMLGGQNLNLAVPVSQLQAMIADDYPNRRSFGASSW